MPKAQIIAALKESGPELAGGVVEGMKKGALVTAAASRLAGTRWLPDAARIARLNAEIDRMARAE